MSNGKNRTVWAFSVTIGTLVALWSMAVSAAHAGEQERAARPGEIVLMYKFHEGDTTRTRLTIDSVTKSTEFISEASWTQRRHQEFIFSVRVSAVSEDGVGTIEMTIESLRVSKERSGAGRVEFDSTKPGQPGGKGGVGDAELGGLVGKVVTMVVAPDGGVREMRGVDHLARAMTARLGEDEEAGDLVQGLVRAAGDDSLRSAMESGLRILPGRPVRRGEAWTSEFTQALPIAGKARSVWKNRLAAVERRRVPGGEAAGMVARIESDIQIELGEPVPKRQGPRWVELAPGIKITMDKSGGSATTLFDMTAGKAIRSEVRLKAPIEIMVEGLEGPKGSATLRQELESVILHEEIAGRVAAPPAR